LGNFDFHALNAEDLTGCQNDDYDTDQVKEIHSRGCSCITEKVSPCEKDDEVMMKGNTLVHDALHFVLINQSLNIELQVNEARRDLWRTINTLQKYNKHPT